MTNIKPLSKGGDTRDQATAALLNAIALYKANDWSCAQMQDAAKALWGNQGGTWADGGPPPISHVMIEVRYMPHQDAPTLLTEQTASGEYQGQEFAISRTVPSGFDWHVHVGDITAIFGVKDVLHEIVKTATKPIAMKA